MTYNNQPSRLGLKDVETLYLRWLDLKPVMRLHHGLPVTEQEFCDHYRVSLSTLRTWAKQPRH